MDCSMPGFPVHHQLPELAGTHAHCVDNAIQPSHPLLPLFSSCLQSLGLQGVRCDWATKHSTALASVCAKNSQCSTPFWDLSNSLVPHSIFFANGSFKQISKNWCSLGEVLNLPLLSFSMFPPYKELMLLNCGIGEDSWESLRLQGD